MSSFTVNSESSGRKKRVTELKILDPVDDDLEVLLMS
eukprot:CAMPEP_0117057906 /NCGR_PEP_ID=MMETSP0472-20121206/40227_1 /TAXON_ID=693140 ORGANISM="Tiarina fusus, Strain LIS" /NCGR_SAMPLE_ID=MMETSP0472 /ASSEMBLY_ACC=CAM_ASM_000603 /LENGTH=36 /DNA_ID= /DNA_START= /DNA_END= /DNA_ORIENTATION=